MFTRITVAAHVASVAITPALQSQLPTATTETQSVAAMVEMQMTQS